jgi:hypothetical protein
LVTVGIALVSITVAIEAFNLKEESDSEHDRVTASLNFFKSMLQFGVSSKHMDYIRESCDQAFDSDSCRERGALAVKFSSSLPSVDFIFSQVARGTRNFAANNRVATYLIDGEATLKARMPTTVDENVRKITSTSRPNGATSAPRPNAGTTGKLRILVDTFQIKANEMSVIYCMFAESTNRSWAAFDDLIKQLDDILGAFASPDDQLRLIRRKAEKLKVAGVDCTNVRAAVDEMLPSGGGDGGGD